MEPKEKEPTALQKVLQKLGGKHTVVRDTLARLQEKSIKISQSALYQTIAGRSHSKEIVDVFLEVAEAEFERRRQVEERARQLLGAS
ncbi:hypothetical protein [Hymenobacter cellulosivorans]|uniref:Uncharacterized protein n=1 Tax=Hymenobacter cellulosivorans TaxID=2932249 RepID=A0ABY4F5W0_9BACT|nr:hypothetical protein [Hymenobacter cellulosivorans]UOQ51725.1 hypothetical protein MUN80_18410 [Hymenobacter cellulosivorans]